jgi:hypothetical protein
MLPHLSKNKSFGWLLFLTIFVATPVAAHEVKTAQDVGGTFHIEPNDTPTAGKPEIAWFALTQKGGKKIPLEQCNCKLAVHIQPHTEGSPPLLQPPLKEISSKQYKTIPSAKIVFPKAGAYDLELSGTPKAGANFKPFELSYEVTVAPGVAAPTKTNSQAASVPTINAQSEQPDNRWLIPVIAIATILGLGIFGIVWRKLNS